MRTAQPSPPNYQLSTISYRLISSFFPPSPPNFRGLAHWGVVSSYSSATAPESHGISCADPLFQARKELKREVAACVPRCKNFFAVIRLSSLQTAGQVH